MSRAYRISASDTVKRQVEIKDGLQMSLELLPVLPAERMKVILQDELIAKGFEMEGEIARRVEEDGIVVEIDLAQSVIRVCLQDQVDIEVSHKLSVSVEEEVREQRQKELDSTLQQQIKKRLDEEADLARQALSEKLKPRLGDIQKELDQIVNIAIAGALKEKAAQLGDIEEIVEEADGAVTIRINL